MNWNEIKWNIFVLIKITTISGNTWEQNTMKLPNICDKKYREGKIASKCFR